MRLYDCEQSAQEDIVDSGQEEDIRLRFKKDEERGIIEGEKSMTKNFDGFQF